MEQRNLILAMALSIGVLLGWNFLFPPPAPPVRTATETAAGATPGQTDGASDVALPSVVVCGPSSEDFHNTRCV